MTSISNNLEALKEILQDFIFQDAELQLNEENKKNGKKIYRNGYYTTTYNSECGAMLLKIPCFRGMKYKCSLLTNTSYANKIINLCTIIYGHGLSTSRITDILSNVYGITISKQTVSDFCIPILNLKVENYFNQDINDEYVAIYLDGKYFSVRDVTKKYKSPLVSAIGLTRTGKKIHLHMDVLKNESESEMISFLNTLKSRIGNCSPVFIVDGNQAITAAINKVFSDSIIQRCLVHVVRNIKKIIAETASSAMQKEIENQFNNLFFETNKEDIEEKYKSILQKYSNYSNKLKAILKNYNIWSFMSFNTSFAELIKTNNCVEQFHSNLEAVSKQHRSYNTKMSLYRAIIQEIERYNSKSNEEITIYDVPCEGTNSISKILSEFKQSEHIVVKIYSSGRKVIDKEIDRQTYLKIKKLLN